MPRRFLFALLAILAVLHQDFWLWDDPSVVLGFLPVSLAYQIGFMAVTASLWAWAVRFAWPTDLEPDNSTPVDQGDSEP